MYDGGGLQLMREVFKKYNIVQFPVGNVGVQMGGWYRKEIKSVADLKGLKFRIGGIGGAILSKLGAVPQQIPPSDIYTSLEKGTIDAAEWIGPYDDEKLGLHKVAKYYYYPGWWEGSAMITLMINAQRYEALPQLYKDALDAACAEQNLLMMAKYDAKNPQALHRLVAAGVQLRQFPRPVLDACYKATFETYDELAAILPLTGRAVALEILVEGRMWDAAEALQKGLLTRVVADAGLEREAYAAARRIDDNCARGQRRKFDRSDHVTGRSTQRHVEREHVGHGETIAQPLDEDGYNVVFQPLRDGIPNGTFEIFAEGFAEGDKEPVRAPHRPTGLAQGPDGALFITDDQRGRIYRVTYVGR